MIDSLTMTIGALYRKRVMVRLDELGLPYKEHRSLTESVIVVKIYNQKQKDALKVFKSDMEAFLRKLAAIERQEQQEELARKNRFRRWTLRKPLTRLPR